MSKRNPGYDFKWCPGCGDFGVKRSVEMAIQRRTTEEGHPVEETVIVAGIGCSGNLVHLAEGPQPFGIHGLHGRTLPLAFGIKMSRQDLNVLIVAGDGDFLSIGGEHIGPQAHRNLDVTAVIMDNGVYGLTKGQSSPTTELGGVTSSTPYGKLENPLNPLELYLAYGVSSIASGISTKPRELAALISGAMSYPGFSIVHVQSPCTTYNDNYEILKGDAKKGIDPGARDLPEDHDPTDARAAYDLIHGDYIPLGVIYQRPDGVTLGQRVAEVKQRAKVKTIEQLLDGILV